MKDEKELNIKEKEFEKKSIRKLIAAEVIGTTAFAACYAAIVLNFCNLDSKLEYEYDDETKTNKLSNDVSYDVLKNQDIITVEDINGNEKIYIGTKTRMHPKVTNFLTGNSFPVEEENFDESYLNVKETEQIEKYLVTFDEMKEYYSYDDLVNILNEISEYKENTKVKTLTK